MSFVAAAPSPVINVASINAVQPRRLPKENIQTKYAMPIAAPNTLKPIRPPLMTAAYQGGTNVTFLARPSKT